MSYIIVEASNMSKYSSRNYCNYSVPPTQRALGPFSLR